MTALELKPCPFCGGRNVGWEWVSAFSTDSSYAFFGCLDCRIGSIEADEDNTMHPDDVSAWNARAPDPDLEAAEARVEELERHLSAICEQDAKPEYPGRYAELRQRIAEARAALEGEKT